MIRNDLASLARDLVDCRSLPAACECGRLRRMERYRPGTTRLVGGRELRHADGASFAFMYKEIFCREIYRFEARSDAPVIIDAGANVGLSVLYFKKLHPKAAVLAFEPDPAIFEILEHNVRAAGVSGVTLVPRAAWTAEGTIPFFSEGADAGRAGHGEPGHRRIEVPAARLREYLEGPVDLLKLDIEGAETAVLHDCADRLQFVDQLFVEYHSFVAEPQRLHELFAALEDAGFRVWADAPTQRRRPFVDRQVYGGMDMQLNVFAYRSVR